MQIDDNGKELNNERNKKVNAGTAPDMERSGVGCILWLPGGPWVTKMLFFFLCAVTALIFIPCQEKKVKSMVITVYNDKY